jgi:integrase/recombinase XerD
MSHEDLNVSDAMEQSEKNNVKHKPSLANLPLTPASKLSGERFQDELLLRTWLHSKSKNTIRAYERIALSFLDFISPKNLKNFSIHDLQAFTEKRIGESRSVLALKSSIIKSLLTHAERTGYLEKNLGVFLPQFSADTKLTERYLTVSEVESLIRASRNGNEALIIELLYFGGLRVSELVALNKGDIFFTEVGEANLKILGKGRKERVVRLPIEVSRKLQAFTKSSSQKFDPVFKSEYGTSKRVTDRTVRHIVFKLAMRAGVLKKVSPHWLRHAHASHALDEGAPISLVQATLGHASVATTGRYLHARPSESSGKYLKVKL